AGSRRREGSRLFRPHARVDVRADGLHQAVTRFSPKALPPVPFPGYGFPVTARGGESMTGRRRMGAVGALLFACLIAASVAAAQVGGSNGSHSAAAGSSCLSGPIKHMVYLQFDNTHYNRDNPSVASDLEQMPHLLNFLKNNGTLFTNDHTVLISHSAGGILSTQTGLYPDRHGQAVSNSFFYFTPSHNPNTGAPPSSFKYWTDLVDDATGTQ